MFSTVPPDKLLSIICSTNPKSCDLDPVPGHLLKCLFPSILPVIHKIANLSLETGRMTEILKQAILKPLLKKPSLDSNDFKNYRPISNLRFISKTIEKCVAKQLIQYLDINDLGETYQSAYKRNHSTETALIRVHNDIAMAIDQHNSVILVLLDLSAAFDTVDHGILLSRLSNRFGNTGTVLGWFQLLSRVFQYSWLVCLLGFSLRNTLLWQSRKSDFGWHRFRFSPRPCLMRKTVEKSEAILALLDGFQCISNGKPE